MNTYLPPLVMDLHVRRSEARDLRIWLPLFLLWPLLLVIFVLSLVGALLADAILFLTGQRYHRLTLLLLNSLRIIAAVRGTHAHIDKPGTLVDFDVY